MSSTRFVYIWTYRIDPQFRDEFLAAYRADGEWARLFQRDSTYLGTALIQDSQDADRYATIDYWTSRADRDAFRRRHRAAFEALDRRCERYTREETFIGDFDEVAGHAGAGSRPPATIRQN